MSPDEFHETLSPRLNLLAWSLLIDVSSWSHRAPGHDVLLMCRRRCPPGGARRVPAGGRSGCSQPAPDVRSYRSIPFRLRALMRCYGFIVPARFAPGARSFTDASHPVILSTATDPSHR